MNALQHVRAKPCWTQAFAAIGEIGLDFYWDRSFEKEQYQAFHQQIEWALHYDLPIVIHSRDSMEQTIAVVREHQKGNLRGIFHCFNEGEQFGQADYGTGFLYGNWRDTHLQKQ